MEIWKKYIVQGNRLYDQNRAPEAIAKYSAALDRAVKLFNFWFEDDEIIAALLTSYHNLGDAYFRQGDGKAGLSCYQTVHQLLTDALSAEQPETKKYAALERGISCSHMNLILKTKLLTENRTKLYPIKNKLNQTAKEY